MTITIKERRLLTSETIKKLQGWRVLEKKMPNYKTIEGGFQSNRLYTVFFLVETDNFGLINLGPVTHNNLCMDYNPFQFNDIYYVMMKVQGYNKIAIDAAIDHMCSLHNTPDIKFIKSHFNLEFPEGSLTLRLLLQFIEPEFTFDL